ncbi:related to TEL1-telomere length control protein [Sporisorium reilianum f. sp. reilianum]|uniref:Serine/threonine-protein kinase TEL1 n=1 Tax=Sporisorium reilianum f. sp. reilianum TaxID=72559 RepID=A0A2N8UHU9_9BASI|nr:related to TEL1-telomere length control protein [Sporisorium reilianum f. sp. reilianum]
MAFSLQDALLQIRSDKIKERQQGLEALEHIFSNQDVVDNLDVKRDGKPWIKAFESLFACVLAEKAVCIRKGSFHDAQPIALARLQRAAQTLRSLVEKSAPLWARKVVKLNVTHILQMLNHRGTLLRPIAPAYMSALCAILKHQHHVDHIEPEDWQAAASLCFNILLSRDLDVSVAPRDPAQWLASLATSASSTPQQRGLSLEDAVIAECLRHLMASTVAPLLGPQGHGLSLLADYTRFLLAFPAESSAHLPAMTGLVTLLEHLELNHTREVIFASLSLRPTILALWRTKNHLLKVQLLLFLRIVVPLLASFATEKSEVASPQDHASNSSLRSEAVSFLELIHEALLRDPDTRWALDPIRLDALVFHWPLREASTSTLSATALSTPAFYLGPYSSEQDSVAWCRVHLQVDIVDALTSLEAEQHEHGTSAPNLNRQGEHVEPPPSSAGTQREALRPRPSSNGKRAPESASSSPQKRRRTSPTEAPGPTDRSCIAHLIETISNAGQTPNGGAAVRLCALQLLTFVSLTRPALVDSTLDQIREVLLAVASDTDNLLVSWSLVGLAAVALASRTTKSGDGDGKLGSQSAHPSMHAWGIAVRKLQNPETCRAAAFLLSILLTSAELPDTVLQPEISRLVAEADLQGPPILCDTVCHLMTVLLHRTSSSRTYQHLDARSKIATWFASSYSPADAFRSSTHLAGGRLNNLFLPYYDLVRLVGCIIAEREPDCADPRTTLTRMDDVTEMLRRRARVEPLRELTLRSKAMQTPTATIDVDSNVAEAEVSLLSIESFNRMSVVLDRKIDACLAVLDSHVSETDAVQILPYQAAIASMHAAILSIDVWSRTASQSSSQRDSRIKRCCHLVTSIIDTASQSRNPLAHGGDLVLQQLSLLDPFNHLDTSPDTTPNELLAHPGMASGIASRPETALTTERPVSAFPRSGFDRSQRLWRAIQEAGMLGAISSSCEQLLKAVLLAEEGADTESASVATASKRDTFDDLPESGSSSASRAKTSSSILPTDSIESVVTVAVHLLAGVPRMLTGNANSSPNELFVSLFLDCPVRALIPLAPVIFGSLRRGDLWMRRVDFVDALVRIGDELLTTYEFARQPAVRFAAIRAVTAVVPLLMEDADEQSELFTTVQTLAVFFARGIGRAKWPTPWEVQLSCARFLQMCLERDPDGHLGRASSGRAGKFAPQASLLSINADADIRVRGLGSPIAASVFDIATSDEEHLSQLYTDFRDGLPSDPAIPQHILTRALSLCNVAIVNSAVRRSALFHLLEIVLATNMFGTTVQHLFAQVAARLGFADASTCYQAFAAQITWGMATNNYDPLQVPWKVLGFASKRDCLEATFAASGSMLLAAQTPEGRTQFDALVQLTRRTQQQGLQECLPFLTAAYLGFAIQTAQQQGQLDLPVVGAQTLRELSQLGFAEDEHHKELRHMIEGADDLIVAALLSLFFEPAASLAESRRLAVTALTQQDAKAGEILSTLTPTGDSSTLVVHEPSRPFFASAILCAAFSALPSLGIALFRKDVVYNVLRHIFHHIASSRFHNDQLRLCAALRIYIAVCGDSFWTDQLNVRTLIKSIELLLGQRHLHDDFRPLLAYACKHSTLARHGPDVLVSCIVTWSVEVADQLAQLPASGDWLLEAARAVAQFSPIATSATVLLWPVKLTSTEQIAIESVIDTDTLTFAIHACPRLSLQLPSLLRIRNVLRKTDKARIRAFCRRSAWKLLKRMADCHSAQTSRVDGDSESDVISDIYASIASVGEDALFERKDDKGDEGDDGVQAACGAFLAAVDTSSTGSLAAAAVLAIHELARTLPLEPGYHAFETLRSIAAMLPNPVSGLFGTKVPPSTRDELERVRPSIGSTTMPTNTFRSELWLDPSLLDASTSSERWICRISAVMCEAVASLARQSIFHPIGRFVATNPTAAKALFHILLLCFTAADVEATATAPPSNGKRRSAARRSDTHEQPPTRELCRAAIATHFEQVLTASTSDPVCSSIIIQALLAVRSFRPVQEEPDQVCYWFQVDTSLLAKRCIACGLYSAAIFFVEHGSWEQDESQAPVASQSRNRTELLHQAYMNIDDPDAFYGITDGDVRELLLKRLHHEGHWLRAFQYHAADYEASNSDGANPAHAQGQALAQSLALLGFRYLVQGVDSAPSGADSHNRPAAFGTGLLSTSWDLPAGANSTLMRGDRVEAVLRTLRQATSKDDVDRPLSMALQLQLHSLCSIPAESVAALRKLQGELLALGQIKNWRKASASLGPEEAVVHLRSVWTRADTSDHFDVTEKVLNTRQSLLHSARQRMQINQIGDVLDGPAEQVARVERLLLVQLSRRAREHEKLQKAINATAQAEKIELALGDGANLAREEFAAVLWDQNEHPPAIQLLSQIVDGLAVTAQSSVQQRRRGARLLALLAQWRATARSQHPREIDRSLFEPAIKLLATSSASDVAKDVSASAELSEIAYQWARFAEEHHRGSDLAEITRLRLYIKSRADEIDQNKREYDRTSSKTERGKLLQFQRQAEKILRQDQTRLTELEASRTHFLRRSVAMYARALSSSDGNDDAVARLVSLWFENADDAELNRLLAGCLSSIPSRKFVPLMHQLSARLTEVPDQSDPMAPFQSNLTQLLLRMCHDHPFHCLYAIFALIKTGADAKAATQRSSSRSSLAPSDGSAASSTPQILRSTAAEKIWNQIKRRTSLGKRIRTFEELCLAFVEWAEFDLTSRPDRYFQSSGAIKKGALRMPPSGELRLARMRDLDVPVATARLEIDPTCKYESFVSIARYSETFTTAGGIHLPKISECIGSDGKRYKQLFKRDDDLRQDAVMQQVFRMVNELLRAERRTRERKLAIRTYTVLPLGPQCGMLEFVTSTVPLGEVLIALHARYRPHDITPTQARSKMRDAQPLPAEAKLEAFLDVCEQMRPAFRYFFSDAQRMPRDWYETRLKYTRSVSTNSIVGHVLGLGDRHVSNILLDKENGELVHIDFGVAFDQGKLLPIPELVPFRLTRDLVDGMGVHGVEGTFRRCCEETLRVLRAHQDVIKTVLEVFRHDPLFAWTSNPIKVLRAQEADESSLPAADVERSGVTAATSRSTPAPTPTPAQARASRSATPFGAAGEAAGVVGTDTAELSADRAVTSVMSKLSSSLSVEYTVNDLIQQAMDAGNLSAIFHGWQAAL